MKSILEKAVIRQIGGGKEGLESLKDVMNHGADAGYPGFTYYSDTCSFFRKYKKEIVELAEELANDLGENVLDMVKGFRCLNNSYSTSKIAKVLYGKWKENDDIYTQVGNAMAWFAAEEIARKIWDK